MLDSIRKEAEKWLDHFSTLSQERSPVNIAASGSQLSRLQPIGKTRSYEQIVMQIEEMIRGGHFQIGGKMPSERALAERFQVSRVVVRESIRNLEARKIVEELMAEADIPFPPESVDDSEWDRYADLAVDGVSIHEEEEPA